MPFKDDLNDQSYDPRVERFVCVGLISWGCCTSSIFHIRSGLIFAGNHIFLYLVSEIWIISEHNMMLAFKRFMNSLS